MPRKPQSPKPLLTRRKALLWAAATPWLLARGALAAPADAPPAASGRAPATGSDTAAAAAPAREKRSIGTSADYANAEYAKLERTHGRIVGVYALDTGSGKETGHRSGERFPFCSTFKAVLVAAVLARDASTPGLLSRHITYTRRDLVSYSPVTEKHVDAGMSVSELCAAAAQYSDNTAANLLLTLLGGPPALTTYVRDLGNTSFRLDRFETELNTAIPGDPRDTVTPADMGRTLRDLVLGNALPAPAREQLKTWLVGNTTGELSIRAGTPAGWQVADKTGAGGYGATNDIAVIWPPARAAIVLAIYTRSLDKHAKTDKRLVAEAARVAIATLT